MQFGPSSGIVDIEQDSPEAEAAIRKAMGGEIPPTPTFISGTKRLPHRIFKFRDDLPHQANLNLRSHGLNIDADFKIGYGDSGSQSVFPPSGEYEWLPGLAPSEISVAQLPDPFIAWLSNSLASGGDASKEDKSLSIRQQLYEMKSVTEGSRDDTLHAESCALWREQWLMRGNECFESPKCQVAVYERLWAWNKAKCVPPLEESRILKFCDGGRSFILNETIKQEIIPKLTSLGLEFKEGEWFPGEWRCEIITADPRRVKLYAPFLPKEFVEMTLTDFDQPTPVHRAVLAETGTVCLSHKPGFWPAVWNGAKIKTDKGVRVTVGLKAKLLRDAQMVAAPLEEQRIPMIAGRVLEWLRKASVTKDDFDPSTIRSRGTDDKGAVWFRFNALLSAMSFTEDKITRNELSAMLKEFVVQERVRGPSGRVRLLRISPSGLRDLEELSVGQ